MTYAYDSYYKHRTGITHGNTSYSFTYDEFGNPLTTSVGNRTLWSNTYKANNGSLQKLTFGNNDKIEYAHDNFGNVKEIKHNDVVVANNYTDASGNVIRSVDKINNLEYRASFDSLNRPAFKDVFDTTITGRNDRWTRSVEYKYDLLNNITQLTFAYKDGTHNTTNYFYDSNNRPFSTMVQSGKTLRYFYDGLDRVTSSRLNTTTPIETEYTFINAGTKTTNVLSTEISNAFAYQYTYDNNGNITAIDNGEKLSNGTYRFTSLTGNTYNYDRYNQLTKDTNYITGDITTYTYDTNGNITQKEVANGQDSTVTTYTYGDSSWGDLLTKYNGQSITYDAIGNPLTYRDGITMTWQNGRELATFTKGTVDVSYTYDTGGLRTSKSVVEDFVSTEYNYVYENGLLRQMTYGNHIFNFSYDVNGTPVSLNHIIPTSGLNEYYYYGVNSRGDVEALYYSDGSLYATYDYDAYGKLLAITSFSGSDLTDTNTVANNNPLRYRSYVYDTETGLYYLQSRYYDPTTCRFINADEYASTGQDINGYNMFAYCNNNPVNMMDQCGNWPQWLKNAVKFVADKIIKPVVKKAQEKLNKNDFTCSTGLGTGGSIPGYGAQVQGGISFDSKGNIAIQGTVSYGISTTAGGSGIVYTSIINAPDVSVLEGTGYQCGGSYGWNIGYVPVMAGLDINIIPVPDTGDTYLGGTFVTGFGSNGFEAHADGTFTGTLPYSKVNIFECAENVYQAIMGW